MLTQPKDIELKEYFKYLNNNKTFIFLVFFILSAFISITIQSLDKIYQVDAVVLPTQSSGSGGGSINLPEGLMALTGFNSQSQMSPKTKEIIKILESKAFIISFLKKNDYIPEVLNARSWDMIENKLSYSSDFDSNKRAWLKKPPADLDAYKAFRRDNLIIMEDIESEFLTISIQHLSPHVALEILTTLIDDINEHMRDKDLSLADDSIDYLNNQLRQTNISEVRSVFSGIIETQLQKKLLANINQGYAFTIIDPPMLPLTPVKPMKIFLLAISLLILVATIFFITFVMFVKGRVIEFKILPFKLKFSTTDQQS